MNRKDLSRRGMKAILKMTAANLNTFLFTIAFAKYLEE
jgi:hypothetical protein